MGESTTSESTSYSKSLLINEAYELAQKLGLIVKTNGLNFEVCSPNEENCAPLLEWYDSVLALGGCEIRYNKNLKLVQDYGFRQSRKSTCWAATATIAWAIHCGYPIINEQRFFKNDLEYVIPHKESIEKYIVSLYKSNDLHGLPKAEVDLAFSYSPDTDDLEARANWLGKIDKKVYENFLGWVKMLLQFQQEDPNLMLVKLQVYITLFEEVDKIFREQCRPLGLPRLIDNEITFYQSCGFSVTEIPFEEFTSEKLKQMADGTTPWIAAINGNALGIDGKDVQALSNEIIKLPMDQLKDYTSHAIIVLDYNPITEEVFILNTDPVSGGSANVPAYVTETVQPPGGNSAQLCVMNFYHFREALISDVKIIAKYSDGIGQPAPEKARSTIRMMCATDTCPDFYQP